VLDNYKQEITDHLARKTAVLEELNKLQTNTTITYYFHHKQDLLNKYKDNRRQ
jgi:uncharacterized membrane-anchored protein YhcB (DUF1043 family)